MSLSSNCLRDHFNGVGTQGPPLTLGELALSLELLHASYSEPLDVSILGRQWVKVIPEILVQTKPKGKAQVKREGGRDRVARLQLLVSFISSLIPYQHNDTPSVHRVKVLRRPGTKVDQIVLGLPRFP